MSPVPVYKIGEENYSDYIEVVELQERNSYDTTKPHKHEYVELFLFTKGGGIHDIDFKNHEISSNSVHFVFPGQIHKVARELDTYGHVILVSKEYFSHLDYDLYVQFFHAFYLKPTLRMDMDSFVRVLKLIDQIKQELIDQIPYYQAIVKDYVHVLIKLFLRDQSIKGVEGVTVDADFKTYMDLLLLVENHYKEHQPISFYSEALQISNRKLNTVCKVYYSHPCLTVINDRIVLEAKKILLYSNNSVKDAMFELNFRDPAYFNRFFKSKTGFTPSGYKIAHVKKYNK
jgi:AraC-like DNA-binding protein/mannose-6-phosphate isomerase-like protein (cupin superfamily)